MKPMSPQLRVITKYKDDEANTPTQTVLMMMVDKIHAAHLAPGVAIRYAAADKKRQTIPWVEYRDASGATRTYLASDTKARAGRRDAEVRDAMRGLPQPRRAFVRGGRSRRRWRDYLPVKSRRICHS